VLRRPIETARLIGNWLFADTYTSGAQILGWKITPCTKDVLEAGEPSSVGGKNGDGTLRSPLGLTLVENSLWRWQEKSTMRMSKKSKAEIPDKTKT
jgi:hypothetical protein